MDESRRCGNVYLRARSRCPNVGSEPRAARSAVQRITRSKGAGPGRSVTSDDRDSISGDRVGGLYFSEGGRPTVPAGAVLVAAASRLLRTSAGRGEERSGETAARRRGDGNRRMRVVGCFGAGRDD